MPPRADVAPVYRREWGRGRPVIALHPLGLESSAFAGFGHVLAARGVHTIAVDLPGFGRTPAPERPLTPIELARPVVALARRLETRPVVLGISLGGRVGLEAALIAPDAFDSVIAIAPALPWLRQRVLLAPLALLDPRMAALMPLEWAWPVLRWVAAFLEQAPYLRDDEVAQAGARFVYYASCRATRASFLSALREVMLAPAFGPTGFWTRLAGLEVPATFAWGDRDLLVSSRFAGPVALVLPSAVQARLPCVGHWLNGPHHRCLAAAVGAVLEHPMHDTTTTFPCVVGRDAAPDDVPPAGEETG